MPPCPLAARAAAAPGVEVPGLARQAPAAGPRRARPGLPVGYALPPSIPPRGRCGSSARAAFGRAVTFALPRWIPGYYARIPLRRYVSGVRLRLDAARPAGEEDAKAWTWTASSPRGAAPPFPTRCALGGRRQPGITQVYVSDQTAFVLPVACTVYVRGRRNARARCGWTFPPGPGRRRSAGGAGRRLPGAQYHEFADSPLESGRVGIASFRPRPPGAGGAKRAQRGRRASAGEASRSAIEAAGGVLRRRPVRRLHRRLPSGGGGDDGTCRGPGARALGHHDLWGIFPAGRDEPEGRAPCSFPRNLPRLERQDAAARGFRSLSLRPVAACPASGSRRASPTTTARCCPAAAAYWKTNENVYTEMARA